MTKAELEKLTDVPEWLHVAIGEVGVVEKGGKEHNKRILEYHATTTLLATTDEIPWCSSFINWCMVMAKVKGTNSAAAKSWAKWGVDSPLVLGAVVVWQHHVGLYVADGGSDKIWLLGGNQSNSVCIKRYTRKDIIATRWEKP